MHERVVCAKYDKFFSILMTFLKQKLIIFHAHIYLEKSIND